MYIEKGFTKLGQSRKRSGSLSWLVWSGWPCGTHTKVLTATATEIVIKKGRRRRRHVFYVRRRAASAH